MGEYRFDAPHRGHGSRAGAAARRLAGSDVLRTVDDALEIRAALRKGTRLAVIGAGWIGAELATAAAARGCAVTVLEAAAAPAAAALGEAVAAMLVPWYAEAGVDLRLGQPVESVQEGGVALPGGGWLEADLVVTAVGVRPSTGWLDGSGVDLANGIVVDGRAARLRPRCLRGRGLRRVLVRPLRPAAAGGALGHRPALAQRGGGQRRSAPSRTTTRCLTSGRSSSAGWSSTSVTMNGEDRLIWRGDPAGERWAACWVSGAGADRLVAVLTVGRPRDMLQGRPADRSGPGGGHRPAGRP